jgi:hypothetical protein
MIKINLILMFYVVLLTSSCDEKNNEIKVDKKSTDTIITGDVELNRKFKKWLNDTLPIIYKTEVVDRTIIVSEDSLHLTLDTEIKIQYSLGQKYSVDISNITELLSEYDELPKTNDSLSFIVHWYYFPSQVEQLAKEFIYEIKNLTITSGKNKKMYNYIRGRISSKDEYSNGQLVSSTDYIWEENKLKKVERRIK